MRLRRTMEPDYTPVSTDPEAADIPSSFYSTGAKQKKRALCPRVYNFRRNFLIGMFVTFALGATIFLGIRRGHIKTGGAGHYMQGDAAVEAGAEKGMQAMRAASRRLQLTTWNIAAINNNPFEYWITYKENPAYEELMVNVEKFLEEPGDNDVPVSQVFTEEMFADLDSQLTQTAGWVSVKNYWDDDFKNRKIVSGFLKDPLLGSKRLASMPDRITNTINVQDSPEPVCRPTVINMYDGDLSDLTKWWNEWKKFMFTKSLKIKTKTGIEDKIPYTMLQTIKRSKYKEVTEQEEKDSLPLQTLCGAIFDAILVHMMNTVASPDVWQPLKRTMVDELNKKKFPHTLQILESAYMDSDIIMLQEVSSAFVDMMRKSTIGSKYHVVAPQNLDSSRDQNSVILLSKDAFPGGPTLEITDKVSASFPEGVDVPVAKGDILAITTQHMDGLPMVVASFHGDTNGLATKPVLDAIVKTMQNDATLVSHRLLFGLDANTYEHAVTGKTQSVVEWGKHFVKAGLTSCWGDVPNPSNYTTYNARTYLQPQLNKACKKEDKREKGDVNPKDFILFAKRDFEVVNTWKDNTGEKKYIEDMAFPTLKFPSDHGLLSTIIQPTKE